MSTRDMVEEQQQGAEQHHSTTVADRVQSWVLYEKWPREYFEPDDQTRAELLEHDSWLEEVMAWDPVPVVKYVERNGFRYPLPVARRKQSDLSLDESDDHKKREGKSTPYLDPRYPTLFESKGSFLRDFDRKTARTFTGVCHQLLNSDQIVPQDSLFHDDFFSKTCQKIQNRNEAMIIQDITRLLVPSAMNLAIFGDTHLDILVESVDEVWTESIPVEGPKPRPDYAVGFDPFAFTKQQQGKLSPLIGSFFDTSFFVASYRMYFPFLTCEVKCSTTSLEIADLQNAHSMTIAVKSVVELYRAVGREKELDRVILAFSVSHDHDMVRIYGHYPVIDGKEVMYYRHPIRKFSFTSEEGKGKWTTYKLTKNVYDIWMPTHFKRICSAIDQLPSGLDFQVSEEPEVQPEEVNGLLQDVSSTLSNPHDFDLTSRKDDELDHVIPQTATTPRTSVSRGIDQRATKRAKHNPFAKQ